MFSKILIANRGEIACRVIKTAKRMGIKTVAIHSEADSNSTHVILADESINIGGLTSQESYLDINKIVDAVKKTNSDAVHPGYGFLSENRNFAEKIENIGKVFVGPPLDAISIMGDKIRSKKIAKEANVSIIPGNLDSIKNINDAKKEAKVIGYPVIIKASAGGGGKGMRVVSKEKDLDQSYNSAINEAKSSFGDERVFIEKYIQNPRHIEIQILGDKFGNYIHLGERECSIQRRHQKVIEEAPSPFVDINLRELMAEQSINLSKLVGYFSAGTVEFVVDNSKNFYFLEMNTRLQVEHPVTELITGIDIVELMIKISADEKLPITQENIQFNGAAIEARIYAEDSKRNFLPSIGRLTRYIEPVGKNIRLDSGVVEGSEISMYYDPMISKLCVHSETREKSINLMTMALDRYLINGVNTNKDFLSNIIQNNSFKKADFSTNFISEFYPDGYDSENKDNKLTDEVILIATFIHYKYLLRAASISNQVKGFQRLIPNDWNVITEDEKYITKITYNSYNKNYDIILNKKYFKIKSDWQIGFPLVAALIENKLLYFEISRNGPYYSVSHHGNKYNFIVLSNRHSELNALMLKRKEKDTSKFLMSPMPGLLVSVMVKEGQKVQAGESLAIVEAMKMENILKAEKDATIKEIFSKVGDSLIVDQNIIEFE